MENYRGTFFRQSMFAEFQLAINDLATKGEYDWFELQLDYNISEGGNSGMMQVGMDRFEERFATADDMSIELEQVAAGRESLAPRRVVTQRAAEQRPYRIRKGGVHRSARLR